MARVQRTTVPSNPGVKSPSAQSKALMKEASRDPRGGGVIQKHVRNGR